MTITWSSLIERIKADLSEEDPFSALATTARGVLRTVKRASREARDGSRSPEFDPDYEPPPATDVAADGERVG